MVFSVLCCCAVLWRRFFFAKSVFFFIVEPKQQHHHPQGQNFIINTVILRQVDVKLFQIEKRYIWCSE
jgi:hypothetical protein